MVAPLGGARAVLGTNPIAFGFPIPGERASGERARLTREGIEIDRRIQDGLLRLAEGTHG